MCTVLLSVSAVSYSRLKASLLVGLAAGKTRAVSPHTVFDSVQRELSVLEEEIEAFRSS